MNVVFSKLNCVQTAADLTPHPSACGHFPRRVSSVPSRRGLSREQRCFVGKGGAEPRGTEKFTTGSIPEPLPMVQDIRMNAAPDPEGRHAAAIVPAGSIQPCPVTPSRAALSRIPPLCRRQSRSRILRSSASSTTGTKPSSPTCAPPVLVRGPANRHDLRAVAVYWHDVNLGYVSRIANAAVAYLLNRGRWRLFYANGQ